MTNKEKEILKSNYQQKYLRLQYVKECSEQGIKGWTKADYKELAARVTGYRIALIDLLEVNKKQGTGYIVVEQWEQEIMEWQKQIEKQAQ